MNDGHPTCTECCIIAEQQIYNPLPKREAIPGTHAVFNPGGIICKLLRHHPVQLEPLAV